MINRQSKKIRLLTLDYIHFSTKKMSVADEKLKAYFSEFGGQNKVNALSSRYNDCL